MENTGEVTLEDRGRQYGATYSVSDGMLHVKTHTETRSIEVGNQDPKVLALKTLSEIVFAQPHR